MHNGIDQQIDGLAAQGCAPAEIAEALGLDQRVVELRLFAKGDLDFDNDAMKEAASVIQQVVRLGESETNRLKAAMFVIEVGRGHKVPKRERPQVNILAVQQAILTSNDKLNAALFGGGAHFTGGEAPEIQRTEGSGDQTCEHQESGGALANIAECRPTISEGPRDPLLSQGGPSPQISPEPTATLGNGGVNRESAGGPSHGPATDGPKTTPKYLRHR